MPSINKSLIRTKTFHDYLGPLELSEAIIFDKPFHMQIDVVSNMKGTQFGVLQCVLDGQEVKASLVSATESGGRLIEVIPNVDSNGKYESTQITEVIISFSGHVEGTDLDISFIVKTEFANEQE